MNLRPHAAAVTMVAAAFAAAPAAVAEEPPPPGVVLDCGDEAGNTAALEEARLANQAAKDAFTSLRGPMKQEVRQLRAEARAAIKQARAELRGAKGAEAKAARAELRKARKTLGKSDAALAKQVQVERKAAKAAWDEAKVAHHALRAALEACDEATDGEL